MEGLCNPAVRLKAALRLTSSIRNFLAVRGLIPLSTQCDAKSIHSFAGITVNA